MRKNERIDLRVSSEDKILIKQKAEEQHMSTSEYLCHLVKKDCQMLSHEQMIMHSIPENQFINSLLVHPELSNKTKQIIGKELRSYV